MSERCPHCQKEVPVTIQEKILFALRASPSALRTSEIAQDLRKHSGDVIRNSLKRLHSRGEICHVARGWWSA